MVYTVFSCNFSEDEDESSDDDDDAGTSSYNSRKRDLKTDGMLDEDGELLSKRICASTAMQEYGGEAHVAECQPDQAIMSFSSNTCCLGIIVAQNLTKGTDL